MKKIKNLIKSHKVWAVILGLIVIGGGVASVLKIRTSLKPLEEKYETVEVKKESLLQTVAASGEIEAETQVTLKFQTSGKLAWVGVKEGDWVEKWQAVAQLDKYELERDLKDALRDYSKERNDFEEKYRVTYSGQTPQTALTDTAKRILEKNQWDLDKAIIDVETADYALKLATLISPIEGLVTDIEEPVAGVNITALTAEITIINPLKMKFTADVDETDIGLVKAGQKATINLDSYPDQTFEGEINQIAFTAKTTSGGGTAFSVEVLLSENDNYQFKKGMNGDCEIVIEQKNDALTIPFNSIKRKEDKTFVQIIDNRKIKEVEIKLGIESDSRIEVIEGLLEGQQVIIDAS